MDPRVLEVRDIRSVIDDKDTGRNALQTEALDSMSKRAVSMPSDSRSIAGGDSGGDEFLKQRARANETPEVKEAYKQLLEATKGMDPKIVEDTLNLATALAESGIKLPAMTAAAAEQARATEQGKPEDQSKADKAKVAADGEEEPGLVDTRISGIYQTLLHKFTNPLVIKDLINVGKDLAQIAMSPQGRALISDMKDLVKHFKEA